MPKDLFGNPAPHFIAMGMLLLASLSKLNHPHSHSHPGSATVVECGGVVGAVGRHTHASSSQSAPEVLAYFPHYLTLRKNASPPSYLTAHSVADDSPVSSHLQRKPPPLYSSVVCFAVFTYPLTKKKALFQNIPVRLVLLLPTLAPISEVERARADRLLLVRMMLCCVGSSG